MKVNPLLNDIARGLWAMSVEGLTTWAPVVHNLMNGQDTAIDTPTKVEAKAIVDIYDSNDRLVRPDENGRRDIPKNSVAVIHSIGPMIKYGDWCTYGSLEIVEKLKAAERDPNIIGIVSYMDGPGGSVSAIAPYEDFGRMKTKPVVGLYDQACSAHVYSMYSHADVVMADNNISATIGSIGVVCSFADNRKFLEKLGYTFHEIYPDESRHKNEAFRLALEGKYDQIKKEMLSPLAVKFQNAVRAARPNLKEKEGVLTGRTFLADEALDLGMIDSIGNLEAAIDRVRVMSEINRYKK